MTVTLERSPSAERLLDRAWAVDSAIRLRQPAWAAAEAEALAADLLRHHQHLFPVWAGIDPTIAEAFAADNRALRAELLTLADEARSGDHWPRGDVFRRVDTFIHHEAIAVGDRAWGQVD